MGKRERGVMGHVCATDGCFNEKYRLKFNAFAGCFPRNINFTDVDALVEIGGRFLMIEWKSPGATVSYAQDRAFKAFTARENIVIVVYGDAEMMAVQSFGFYASSEYHKAIPATLEDLRARLKSWAVFADTPEKQSA